MIGSECFNTGVPRGLYIYNPFPLRKADVNEVLGMKV